MRLALVALMLVGCQNHLDRDKLEKSIVAQLQEKGVTDATAVCPEVEKLVAGKKFTCAGTGFGKPYVVDVLIQDDIGTVKWDLDGKIVDTKKLAAHIAPLIQDKVGAEIAISCTEPMVIVKAKDSLVCDLTEAGEKKHVKLTDDNGDNVAWEIVK